MNDEEFRRVKKTVANKPRYPIREYRVLEVLVVGGGVGYANLDLVDPREGGDKSRTYWHLHANKGKDKFERFLHEPEVEVVYDMRNSVGTGEFPEVHGDLLAIRAGKKIEHCFF